MRFKLLVLFLCLSVVGSAQFTNYTRIANRYRYLAGAFDSTFTPPLYNGTPSGLRGGSPTLSGHFAIDTANGRPYFYQSGNWQRLAKFSELTGGALYVDSLWRVPGKDSIFWLKNGTTYKFKDSTGGGGSYTSGAVDSVWRVAGKDSVFWLKNGVTYKFKDSTGGGGSQNLQQVTTVGNSTSDTIIISNDNSGLLTANTDTVVASGYDGIPTGAADLGGVQNIYIFNEAQRSRIRQTGTITQIKIYLASKPGNLTGLFFDVWRKDGSTWDSVAHVPILSLVSGGTTNTVTLPYPVNVQEGDFTGISYTGSSSVTAFMKSQSQTGGGWYRTSAPSWTNHNWLADISLNAYAPVQVFMQAPVIVSIGNSIQSAYPYNYSFIETTETNSWQKTTSYKVADTLNVSHQLMSISGQTTTQILARFKADVVDLKPKIAILEGGVNDIDLSVATSTIKANWKAMIDSCVTNDIVPVVMLIYPWTNGSNAEMQKLDSINYYLDSLCAADYPTAKVVDVKELIGEFRVGGDPGNFWNIKAAYDYGDGVHLNEAGNEVIASAILDEIPPLDETKYHIASIKRRDAILTFPTTSGEFVNSGTLGNYIGSGLEYGNGTVKNQLSIGKAGGQNIYGGTAANEDLEIEGTTNATKTTSYVNLQPSGGRVGIGTRTPTSSLHVVSTDAATMTLVLQNTNTGTTGYTQLGLRNNAGNRLWMFGVGNTGETSLAVKSKFYIYDSTAIAMRMVIDTTGNVGFGTVNPANRVSVAGNLQLTTAGNKLLVQTGSNASIGTGTLSGGTATINTTAAVSTSLIFIQYTSCSNCGTAYISTINSGTSFTVTSTNGSDASTFNWWIIN